MQWSSRPTSFFLNFSNVLTLFSLELVDRNSLEPLIPPVILAASSALYEKILFGAWDVEIFRNYIDLVIYI